MIILYNIANNIEYWAIRTSHTTTAISGESSPTTTAISRGIKPHNNSNIRGIKPHNNGILGKSSPTHKTYRESSPTHTTIVG